MSSINLDAADNYLKGLTVNGNLRVDGILFMPHNKSNCPSKLLEADNTNNILESCTFKGNLHIHPGCELVVSGNITSKNFQSRYK